MSQAVSIAVSKGRSSWQTMREARQRAQEWWKDAPPRTRTTLQLTALIASVVVAYNYSLVTLYQSAGLDTPLAYVSLVPAIALALAAVRARPIRPEPAIHDRQVDYIVGLPLVISAVAINELLPAKLSAMFWVYRIDLLTLPIFVAGAVIIIFGLRVFWRQKLAVAYLLLAWPLPYSLLLLRELNTFTAATVAGLRAVLHVFPVAKEVPSVDQAIFTVVHHGRSFPLSVVSACSGVNGMVGFLLIGSAFAVAVRGPMVRKVAWLIGGMLLLWVMNVMRILFIFWAGRTWGEHIAIGILHPFVGLVTFSFGVLVMILLIKPLGMHVGLDYPQAPGSPTGATGPLAGATGAAAPRRRQGALAVPKPYAAVIVVVVTAAVLGFANFGLRSFNLVADASGAPRLLAYAEAPVAPAGWTTHRLTEYDWAKPLFGTDSTWFRYVMSPKFGSAGDLRASTSVTVDVINTSDLGTFAAYGIEACYQFHGYSLHDVQQVQVGGGVTGQAISYTTPSGGSWSIVYWIVPVKALGGTTTRYDRVVLYVQGDGGGVHLLAGSKNLELEAAAQAHGQDAVLTKNRDFLVAFAKETIQAQSKRAAGPVFPARAH